MTSSRKNAKFRFPIILGGAILSVLALLLTVLFTGTVLFATDSQPPSIFLGDSAWEQDYYYPADWVTKGGTDDCYIPLVLLESMNGVKVRRGSGATASSFVISDTESGKYLSFNATTEYAQTERSTLLYIRTKTLRKEWYVPMRDIFTYFGWDFEIRVTDEFSVLRIVNGTGTKTLDELLAPYLPKETEAVTEPPETEPTPETEEPSQGEQPIPTTPPEQLYRASVIYLTFEGMDDEITPQIADILEKWGVSATFFVTGEELVTTPDTVMRLEVDGFTLGLHTMTDDDSILSDTDTILASLEAENELFYKLTGEKRRIVRLPNGSYSTKLQLTNADKTVLADNGYILWDWNISAMDHAEGYTAEQVFQKITDAMKTVFTPVIRFHCTENTLSVLPRLLALISAQDNMTVSPILDSTAPTVFPS